MSRTNCPMSRLHDTETGKLACLEWCPLDECVESKGGAPNYEEYQRLFETRKKILNHNCNIRFKRWKERKRNESKNTE